MGFVDPIQPLDPEDRMKLRALSYLMLGMLRLGAKSGYAIKKATDLSTRFFWPTSLAQVYPELAKLERSKLVSRRDDPRGGRRRAAYALTPKGEKALLSWLRSEREGPTQFRDEGVLRLFFADALPPDDQLALVRRLRERARGTEAHLRQGIVPVAEELEEGGVVYPTIVARLGADTHAYVDRWLGRLEKELDAGRPGR
jgi:DNA-binding PadR family transcriptional regulator